MNRRPRREGPRRASDGEGREAGGARERDRERERKKERERDEATRGDSRREGGCNEGKGKKTAKTAVERTAG